MIGQVVLDAGPLVAGLVRRDTFYEWATTQFRAIQPPLLTCEPVITEACYLLREFPEGIQQVNTYLQQGVIQIAFTMSTERARLFALMHSYRDVPMSLADACLVRMAELIPESRVLTLDADFLRYRKHGRQQIPLIIPEHPAT